MKIRKIISFLVVLGWLISTSPTVEAAPKKSTAVTPDSTKHHRTAKRGSIHGEVTAHGKPVAGAKVHLAHKHAKHQSHTAKTATAKPAASTALANATKKAHAAKTAAQHKTHHHGVVTGAEGHFAIKSVHAGSHLVVAHKKHVGTGHAKATVKAGQSAHVVIKLHKHHHHHSGTKAKKPAK